MLAELDAAAAERAALTLPPAELLDAAPLRMAELGIPAQRPAERTRGLTRRSTSTMLRVICGDLAVLRGPRAPTR